MEGQGLSKLAAKLITRSKAKVSVGHRKLVNYLDNISRDESGAPVKWKFNKNSVKIAKGISKKLAKVNVDEPTVKRLQSKPQGMSDNSENKAKETGKGRKSVVKKGKSAVSKKQMASDSLIISIRRLDDNKTSTSGATERIVTFGNSKEGEAQPKKPGRKPKSKTTSIKETDASSFSKEHSLVDSIEKLGDKKDETSSNLSRSEALKNLEQEVAIKRGRSTSWTSLNQKVMKKAFMEKMRGKSESKSRDSSEDRIESDMESVDSNFSGASEKKKKKKHGILPGPRKLLRSQDTLITRGKKTEIQAGIKRRKRTLSGEFDLLDERSLKKKLKKEQDEENDDAIQNTSIVSETSEKLNSSIDSAATSLDSDEGIRKSHSVEMECSVVKNNDGVKEKRKPGRPKKIKKDNSKDNKDSSLVKSESSALVAKTSKDDNNEDNEVQRSSKPKRILRGSCRGRVIQSVRPSFKFLGKVYKHVDSSDVNSAKVRGRGKSRGRSWYKSLSRKHKVSSDNHDATQIIPKEYSEPNENLTPGKSSHSQGSSAAKLKKAVFKFGSLTIIGPGSYEINTDSCDSNLSEDSNSTEMPVLEESPKVYEVREVLESRTISPEMNDSTKEEEKLKSVPFIAESPVVDYVETDTIRTKTSHKEQKCDKDSMEIDSDKREDIDLVSEDKIEKFEKENLADVASKQDSFVEDKTSETLVCSESSGERTLDMNDTVNNNEMKNEEKDASFMKHDAENDSDKTNLLSDANEGELDSEELLEKVTSEVEDPTLESTALMDNVVSSTDNSAQEIEHSLYIPVSKGLDSEDQIPSSSGVDQISEVGDRKKTEVSDEVPGEYFRKVENESEGKVAEHSESEQGSDNSPANLSGEIEQDVLSETLHEENALDVDGYEDVISVQVTVGDKDSEAEIDKDESSNSSVSSLDQSNSSLTSLKEEQLTNISPSDSRTEGKTKRQYVRKESKTTRTFQLRQKASRSPLEIIAMRQSEEEKQYLLEQSQKAMKREEKQKKRQRKEMPLFDTEAEAAGDVDDPNVLPSSKNVNIVQYDDNEKETMENLVNMCKPCSVVLIDFVKFLKNERAQDNEGDSCTEEEDAVEEIPSQEFPLQGSSAETKGELEKGKNSSMSGAEIVGTPMSRRRHKPSARKQAKSYNFKQKFTAEIVNYPLQNFDYNPSTTVPPLRLKIKPNVTAEPKKRGRYGKRKARKSFSPSKTPSKSFQQNQAKVDSPKGNITCSNETKSENLSLAPNLQKVTELPTKGFEGSYVQFIRDKDSTNTQQNLNATPKKHEVIPRKTPDPIIENKQQNVSPSVIERKQIKEKLPSAIRKDGKLKSRNEISEEMKYECTYNSCGYQTSKRDEIKSHIYVHLKNTPFKCLHCQGVFKTRTEAFLHSRSEHHGMDVMIEPAEFVDETQYFKHVNNSIDSDSLPIVVPPVPSATPPSTPPQKKILQAEVHQVEQSPEAVIIKVVLPGTVHPPKGCYCCSYCDFSSSVQQEILNHINENHRPDIQYTCSICNKVFLGNKEGIASHFAQEHPNQPILYKSMPDFYDVGKSHAQASATVTSGPDKGNIFDRMSDLFSPQEQMKHGKRAILDRTSAEADSTTAEGDLVQGSDGSKVTQSTLETEEKMDGIEELGKSYQGAIDTQSKERTTDAGQEKDTQDDIGLKIVDVVSLSDQVASVWNEATGQSGDGNSHTGSPYYPPSTTKSIAASTQSPADAISALRGHLQPVSSSFPHGESSKQQANSYQSKAKSDLKICTTYKCEKCNVHAPVLASMVEHLRISHKDIEKLFLCPYCRQYEGATEPDIHRHIKQFHQQNMQQKSPPVALSSAAKQHLRTIQVPAGDANKIGDKYIIEKDIYKCLKCNGHMPSLDFIYTHIEKQHNEFFVNVCPYCKVFKSKDEEVVLNHIRQIHERSTEDITLSVAIEENLFTRVQCLVKSKPAPPKPIPQSAATSESFAAPQQNSARMSQPVTSVPSTTLSRPQYQQPVFVRPNIPLHHQSQVPQMTFPSNVIPQSSVPFGISAPLSKSSLRKSRPQHRDKGMALSPGIDSSSVEMRRFQLSPRNDSPGVPPPLLRAPPPLIRFQNSQLMPPSLSQNVVQARPSSAEPLPLSSSYSKHDRMQTVYSSGRTVSPQISAQGEGEVTATSRPVLKVPSVRSSVLSSSPPSRPPPPPYDVAKFQKTSETTRGTPLDLSRALVKPSEQIFGLPAGEGEQDDMPPDAFQIFNIRPGSQPSPEESANYNQFQVRPNRPDIQRQRFSMAPHQIRGPRPAGPPGIMYSGFDNPLRPFTPRSNTLRSPPPRPGTADSNISTIDRRVFKCPYCTHVVPLNMGEVAPHIEKYHPGHSIVFSKLD